MIVQGAALLDKELASKIEEIGSGCYCLQSRMTARSITRKYNSLLAPLGLEVTEFSLLAALQLGRHMSVTDLADHLAFERTTLVRNLKRLVDRGLIKRASDEGRAVRYVLADEGLRLLKDALPVWDAAQGLVRERLPENIGADVLRSLKMLRTASTASDES